MFNKQQESKFPERPSRIKLIVGSIALVVVALIFVLAAQPFSGARGADTAAGEDDGYALRFGADGFDGDDADPGATKTKPVARRDTEEKFASACARCAKRHRVAPLPVASTTTRVAPGAASSAEIKRALKQQGRSGRILKGDKVKLWADGRAEAPDSAPDAVQNVVAAGNAIRDFPYIWGGGHGSFQDSGYDCSGSVSYALKGAGLVGQPMTSGEFMNWGEPGPGKWITVYANGGHMFMVVGGLRFDTSFRDGPFGSRWQQASRGLSGFAVRHPAGL